MRSVDPTLTFFTAGAIHEITAMGRISLLGESNLYSVIDLFRYTAPGGLDPTAASGAYFSIDDGNTVINIFSGSHRWTDGHALLPPELLDGFAGEISLEVHLSDTELRYPTDTGASAGRFAGAGANDAAVAA